MTELVLKKVQLNELEQYRPYLLKFHEFWVVGVAFRIATLGWKFYDDVADSVVYEIREITEIYELPRRPALNLPKVT
jgi:hypothetical protein